MRGHAQQAAAGTSVHGNYRPDRESDFGALDANERIGRPLRDRTRSSLPWGGMLAVISASAGLIVFEAGPSWRAEPFLEPPTAHPRSTMAAPDNIGRFEKPETYATGLDATGDAGVPRHEEPQAAVVAELATHPYETPPREPDASQREAARPGQTPRSQQEPQSTDPIQQRAVAAGLHPGLSRVLLRRLSPTDLRNAGVAIKTALSETASDAVFVWPREARADLARFRVRFVTGAAPGCRRYIVEVIKDRWVTTALPVEKCGLSGPLASRE